MNSYRTSLLLQCLIFLIPLNIYMWGDWLLINVQWALFRYQQYFHESAIDTSVILGHRDILYIFLGQNTGLYNIAAASFWTIGSVLLLIGLCITIFAYIEKKSPLIRTASYATTGGGIVLGLSALCRFQGGFAIPVGVPIIFIIGWWMYQEKHDDDGEDEEEPGLDSEEEPGTEY